MKRGTLPFAIAISTSLVACDTTGADRVAHRDVYHSLEDCVADWGDIELCEQQMKEAREHAEKIAAAQAQHSGGTVPLIIPMFMGPEYIGSSRTHTTPSGQTFVAKSNNAARTATFTTNAAAGTRTISYAPGPKANPNALPTYSVPRAANPSSSTVRGGFSSSARGFSSGGG